MGKKRGKGKAASAYQRMLAGNALRQGGRSPGSAIRQPGGPRPAPVAPSRRPEFEHEGRHHALTFRKIEGTDSHWRCSCGSTLTVPHRAREDAGERAALDSHCLDLKGVNLDTISREAARKAAAARQAARPKPTPRPAPPSPPRAASKGSDSKQKSRKAGSASRPTPRTEPPEIVFPWQRSQATPLPKGSAPKLCPNCGVNELNCRC